MTYTIPTYPLDTQIAHDLLKVSKLLMDLSTVERGSGALENIVELVAIAERLQYPTDSSAMPPAMYLENVAANYLKNIVTP